MDDIDLGYLMAVAGALVWTPRLLRAWLDAFGSPRRIVDWTRGRDVPPPADFEPLGESAISRLAAIDDRAVHEALAALERSGARALTAADSDYPPPLADLCDPPPVLYVRGDPASLASRAVAIVGSRAATAYGRNLASQFAADFGAFGAVVISGLARGIDAAAHKGAIASQTRTVAVIGSGLGALYPPYHSLLADEIVDAGGAVLSEFPPDLHAMAHHFPMRNRIVAALAQATVVVEAGTRSGALITARLADELGRHVFAVPGDVGRPTSAGTNSLIKDGVPLVTSASDVTALVGWQIAMPPSESDAGTDPILKLIGRAGTSIDDLCERTGLDAASLLARLTLLEIGGVVARLPGGGYATVKAARPPKHDGR